jgi:protein-S-isoprenylcysteine O-methyltransferase
LGISFGLGIGLALFSDSLWDLGFYLAFLGFFHFSEYLCVAIFNPKTLTSDSFLVNHSTEFNIAMAASFAEYFIELWLFPEMKGIRLFAWLGVLATAIGQGIRLAALITAGHNFTHDIAEKKRPEHKLVTTGIYNYIRHPGYCGWFWWSVCSQLVLFNPICIAGFAYASWLFFKDRIEYEEKTLVEFFGKEYEDFRKRTPTYVPLIP